MKTCLDKLFIETEQERKEQENRERQQAAQIAEGTGYHACYASVSAIVSVSTPQT